MEQVIFAQARHIHLLDQAEACFLDLGDNLLPGRAHMPGLPAGLGQLQHIQTAIGFEGAADIGVHRRGKFKVMIHVGMKHHIDGRGRQVGAAVAALDGLDILQPVPGGILGDIRQELGGDIGGIDLTLRSHRLGEQARVKPRAGADIGNGVAGLERQCFEHIHAGVKGFAAFAGEAGSPTLDVQIGTFESLVDGRRDAGFLRHGATQACGHKQGGNGDHAHGRRLRQGQQPIGLFPIPIKAARHGASGSSPL